MKQQGNDCNCEMKGFTFYLESSSYLRSLEELNALPVA